MSAPLEDLLRWHRHATGMTGTEVAAAMEISPATISRWETGHSCPTIVQLRLLARVLAIHDYWNLLR